MTLLGVSASPDKTSCYINNQQKKLFQMKKSYIIVGMVALSICFFVLIGLSVSSSSPDVSNELKLLHIVMRHGIRTPASTYPNDPYKNDTFYPIGWGQLTNPGKLELYQTGQWLRQRYGKFLGDFYSPDEYYTQSTDVDRAKASMQLVNAGLWPPGPIQKWGPLDWQPIPIHSEPLDKDNLLLVRRPCAQYHLELDRVKATPEIQKKLKEHEQLFKELEAITGQKVKDFEDVQDIYTTLLSEQTFNLTLPEWTKKYYPDKLEAPSAFSFALNAYTDKLQRLKGGVLLKKILNDYKQKQDGTISPKGIKAFLYGGHDATISNLLSSLKVFDPQVPGYGVAILLELSEDKQTKEWGLELFFRNSTTLPPYQLQIPGCDKFCPLGKLVELTKNVIPEDWEKECASDDPNYTPPPPGGP